jgi:tetratricopeptide (TPR) repeat protein
MKVAPERPSSLCSHLIVRSRNTCAPKPARYGLCAVLSRTQALLCVLAMAVSVLPFYGQRPGGGGGGSHGSTRETRGIYFPPIYRRPGIDPTMQPIPDIPTLPKPTITYDEKCFPWKISEARATSVSVAMLKVPSKARHEFEKACDALNKNKFEEAEQHTRKAIDKAQNYSAAWVMLGLVLEQQNKPQEAGDACSHAVTLDATYLPAYLCKAEFAVRNREWKEVLDLADMAQGLNSQGDAYVYYYRATAYLHTNKLAEARKSALQAEEIDVDHSEPFIYFLAAQIYDREGDKANAIAQLQQLLKHHADRKQQEEAKQFLAKLESQQSTQ